MAECGGDLTILLPEANLTASGTRSPPTTRSNLQTSPRSR